MKCIIAGAGGAAHLPGMTASMTILPVLGVPVKSRTLQGVDSLFCLLYKCEVPTATFAVGEAGATNAALFAISILATNANDSLSLKLKEFRDEQKEKVEESKLPPLDL